MLEGGIVDAYDGGSVGTKLVTEVGETDVVIPDRSDGNGVGNDIGKSEGCTDGRPVGLEEGDTFDWKVGIEVDNLVDSLGFDVGTEVGTVV
jgi:hypothetical protein